jgi:hypothetical protein
MRDTYCQRAQDRRYRSTALLRRRTRDDHDGCVSKFLQALGALPGGEHRQISIGKAAHRQEFRLGSDLGKAAGEHVCPTCHQDVSGELLPVVENVGMGLEENIAFVRSQIDLYNTALQGALDRVTECRGRYRSKEDQLKEKQAELRSLRQALVQPSASPSRVMIETIVRLQAQLDRMTSLTDAADVSDGRQVIVSTSEPLKSILAEVGSRARVVSFVGFILQPLDGGNPNLVN